MAVLFLAAAALLIFGAAAGYRRSWNRGIGIQVHFDRESIPAGEELCLLETVENRKRLPVAAMEVAFRVPKGLRFLDAENTQISDYIYKRDLFSLRGLERIQRTYHMTALERGQYRISHISHLAPGLFFRQEYLTDETDPEEILYVLPARVNVSGILRAVQAIQGERQSLSRRYEDPFSFSSIREYTTSDPMKYVNWKASAKSGGLMVNTFSSPEANRVHVLLELGDDGVRRHPEQIEDSISIAATIYAQLIRSGQSAALTVGVRPEAHDVENTPAFDMQQDTDTERSPGTLPSFQGGKLTEAERFLTRDFELMEKVSAAELVEFALGGSQILLLVSRGADQKLCDELAQIPRRRDFLPMFVVVPCHDRTEFAARDLSGRRGAGGKEIVVIPWYHTK